MATVAPRTEQPKKGRTHSTPRTGKAEHASAARAPKRGYAARAWSALKDTFWLFLAKRGQSRGAAIAFYAVTSLAPVLVIVIAVAGFVYGDAAAQGAIFDQFKGLLGPSSADLLQRVVASASRGNGAAATAISIIVILVTASGVFLELEDALNAIWECEPQQTSWWDMAHARLMSFGLVLALGLLMVISLAIDAGLKGASGFINRHFPLSAAFLFVLNTAVSFALVTLLFGAIYKVLPATPIRWRTAIYGALVTAGAYQGGKVLIALYIGSQTTTTSLGAAGALLALLFWVYYSAMIFILGAAFTRRVFGHEGPVA
jgi:membrane protein